MSNYNNRSYGNSSGDQRGSGSLGFFRAQPLDLGVKKKKKLDPFTEGSDQQIDYKDPKTLSRYMSERGRIFPRRMTGLTAENQRKLTRAIKRAQHLALLPYTGSHK